MNTTPRNYLREYQSSFCKSLVRSSFVVYTGTKVCCLKSESLDQIAAFQQKARARKGASLWSGWDWKARLTFSLYTESSWKEIRCSISFNRNSNSCLDSFDFWKHSGRCLLNSDLMCAGAKQGSDRDAKTYEAAECGFNNEKKIFVSRTNFISYPKRVFFSWGESVDSTLFHDSSLISLPFLTAHASKSRSSLDSSCRSIFSIASCRCCSSISSSRAVSDQFTQENSVIPPFSSSETGIVSDTIQISPRRTISSNFRSCFTRISKRWRKNSRQFISGCLSSFSFSSLGILTVMDAIFVCTREFVCIFKDYAGKEYREGRGGNTTQSCILPCA